MKPLIGKSLVIILALGLGLFALVASAYEYPLQFTPNAGYLGLVVAGYYLSNDTVVGNCSYHTVHSGSGKGGGYRTITTYYNQTCTWDLHGNLLSIAQGSPVVPPVLSTNGTQTIYANNGVNSTGSDSALRFKGFVTTPSPHYTWLTSNAYAVLPDALYTFTVTLASDGDIPVNFSALNVSALRGTTTLNSTTCTAAPVAAGTTCSATVTYDPTKLRSTTGAGLAYDTLTIGVVSDAGQAYNFVQSYTITGVPLADD